MTEIDAPKWLLNAVIYQIYPRSFADSNNDGIGDLQGIIDHIDYVADLGVDAIWVSPIFRSPMIDMGYDISDYRDVDPLFGDIATLDRLINAVHERGLRILLDFVGNHTSDQHPWFVESRSSRDNPKRDWYIWRDKPNNWGTAWGGSAWTFDEKTQQYYLHNFHSQQPDLNWNNPQVQEAMHDVIRFWLDRGIDGFRADVIHMIGKDEELADVPEDLAHKSLVGIWSHPNALPLFEGIRNVFDEYPDKVVVGEINLLDASKLTPYVSNQRLHSTFEFQLIFSPWDAQTWGNVINEVDAAFGTSINPPTWVLSNHDEHRARSRFGDSEERSRVAALIMLCLRGPACLYAGEELGLLDADVPPLEVYEDKRALGCRAPIPWDNSPNHGWATQPWLSFPANADTNNVEAQKLPESIYSLYKQLIKLRRTERALREGSCKVLPSPPGVLVFERSLNGEEGLIVAANFSDEPITLPQFNDCNVIIDTDMSFREHFSGVLDKTQAVLLRSY